MKGESAIFTCAADGNPTPTYTWLKDGKLVSSSPTFSIEIVSYASAGEYVCVANNTIEAGWKTGRASATVEVEGMVIGKFEYSDSCDDSQRLDQESLPLITHI